jgi:hypothetical protein
MNGSNLEDSDDLLACDIVHMDQTLVFLLTLEKY